MQPVNEYKVIRYDGIYISTVYFSDLTNQEVKTILVDQNGYETTIIVERVN